MAQALVNAFKPAIGGPNALEAVVLVPSSGGRYEITVDDRLVYSKYETKQHISDEDAVRLVKQSLGS